MRRPFLLCTLALALTASAAPPVAAAPPVVADAEGLAIGGYDPVA